VPIRRREALVVGAALLVALLVRGWHITDASLNHYDEGVYGLTAWGLADPDRPIHPEQRNSPIALPFLSSLAFRAAGGPSDLAPLLINVLIGTLTIPLLWFVVRRWFGPLPAVAAATLLAFSEFHIAMSRSGMTDVLFAFLFLAAVPAVSAALQRPSARTTIAAGLLVGAAWNTKYHGWLAAVVATAGLVPYARFAGWTRRQYLGALAGGIGLTLIAVACYVPWALKAADLSGGYAALTAYQMQSLSSHWLRNFGRYAGSSGISTGWCRGRRCRRRCSRLPCSSRGRCVGAGAGRWLPERLRACCWAARSRCGS
jgi:4-amino-4-deoxy-L-arabinose transferase-like glycosyltransferase